MSKPREFTFVVAVNNRDVFETHFLASPCLGAPHAHEVLVQEGFKSASQAYNDAIDRARNDFIVFVHQDVILPERWLDQLESSLDYLEENDPQWGVLGCYGETRSQGGRGYVYSSGLGIIGQASEHPMPVQTLDEIVLVLRKSSGLRFDGNLPHFHLYGTDICLRAEQLGRKNYALSAFCIHNTNQGYVLPKEFYECYWRIRGTWKSQLPIQATCIRITRSNLLFYKRKLQEIYLRSMRRSECGEVRSHDVPSLLKEVDRMLRQNSALDRADSMMAERSVR
jgi:hypothetical protein